MSLILNYINFHQSYGPNSYILTIVEDFEKNPERFDKNACIESFRNLLVIDGFEFNDDDWRLNIRPMIQKILDKWHTATGEYRRKRKAERLVPSLNTTSPKVDQLWDLLVHPKNGLLSLDVC